jgi:hypothetical protein
VLRIDRAQALAAVERRLIPPLRSWVQVGPDCTYVKSKILTPYDISATARDYFSNQAIASYCGQPRDRRELLEPHVPDLRRSSAVTLGPNGRIGDDGGIRDQL